MHGPDVALWMMLLGAELIVISALASALAPGRWLGPLVAYELTLPKDTSSAAAAEFVAGLAGLVRPRWRRLGWGRSGIGFEVSATPTGVRHHLLIPRPHVALVMASLRAAMPGAVARLDETYTPVRPRRAIELATSHHGRPLHQNTDGSVSRAVLAALQPLRVGERVVITWDVSPMRPRPQIEIPQTPTSSASGWGLIRLAFETRPLSPEDAKNLRAKQTWPLFMSAGRVAVEAPTPSSAKALVVRVKAALHAANAPGVHLRQRHVPGSWVRRDAPRHTPPGLVVSAVLNAAEITGLAALPVGDVQLPGVVVGTSRPLPPASDVAPVGLVLGDSTFPGLERPVALSPLDTLRHMHVLGPTGVGKSTLLVNMITQDMEAGRGLVVIDPKADLVADVLDRVPSNRLQDVIVLDATDEQAPVGFNPLSRRGLPGDLVAEQLLSTFSQLYRASWGARTDDLLRACLLTLVASPGTTLVDLPQLLTNPAFRRRLVARVDDPVVLGPFWAAYDAMSDAARATAIAPLMNKARAFLVRPRLRNVLAQPDSKLSLDEVLAHRRILLVPLSKGLLGADAAALFGALVMTQLWQAVQRRSGLHQGERPATTVYVDEFADIVRLPLPLGDALAQARGLGVGMVLAHQHLDQLTPELKAAVLANTRSRIVFQTAANDAAELSREMPPASAEDLKNLDAYQAMASLSVGNRVAPALSLATRPAPDPTGNAEVARELSRNRYGCPSEEVEQALRRRYELLDAAEPIGRREVTS